MSMERIKYRTRCGPSGSAILSPLTPCELGNFLVCGRGTCARGRFVVSAELLTAWPKFYIMKGLRGFSVC